MAYETIPFHGNTNIKNLRAQIYQQGGKLLSFKGVTENATQTQLYVEGTTPLILPRESLALISYKAIGYNVTDHANHLIATGTYGVLTAANGTMANVAAATAQTALVGTTGHHAFDLSTVVEDGVTLGYVRLRVTGLASKKINWATWLEILCMGEPNNVSAYPLGA